MSLSLNVAKGSFTLLSMQMVLRSLGLVSTLILARILTPSDFGIVAIVSMAVFLFDVLSESGAVQYIVQKENVDDEDLNTAWTINIILKLFVWTMFILSVPLLANYFEDIELLSPLYSISFLLLINSFYNTGMYLHQKELRFKPFLVLNATEKLISMPVTVVLAIAIETYWAMIVGMLVSYSVKTILSFVLHKYRPRLSLKNLDKQWSFSLWMLSKGLLGYTRSQFDNILVSKYFGITSLGGYNMMKDLISMVGRDLINPATAPLLSSFSKVKGDLDALKHQTQVSLLLICIVIFPVAHFTYTHSSLIVLTLFGKQWEQYSNILGIMAFLLITHPFVAIFQQLLISLGKVKKLFYFDLLDITIMVVVLLFMNFEHLSEFALIRCLLAIGTTFLLVGMINVIVKLKIFTFILYILILLIACTMSEQTIKLLITSFEFQVVFFELVKETLLYFSFYFLFLLVFLTPLKTKETNFIREKLSLLFQYIIRVLK